MADIDPEDALPEWALEHNAHETKRMGRNVVIYATLTLIAAIAAWRTHGLARTVLAVAAVLLGLATAWIGLFYRAFSTIDRNQRRRRGGPAD